MSVTDEPRTKERDRVKSPPQPIDGKEKDNSTLWRTIVGIVLIVIAAIAFFSFFNRSPEVNSAEDISVVYDHAIVLQAREGDTLESASLAVFPNTLVEQRVRDDNLGEEAKLLERERYQVEWLRLTRLLTGTTGTSLTPGEFFAIPAKADEPGAIDVSRVSSEIQQLTEQARQAAAGD